MKSLKLIVADFKGRSRAQAPENKIIDHMFLTSGKVNGGGGGDIQ